MVAVSKILSKDRPNVAFQQVVSDIAANDISMGDELGCIASP